MAKKLKIACMQQTQAPLTCEKRKSHTQVEKKARHYMHVASQKQDDRRQERRYLSDGKMLPDRRDPRNRECLALYAQPQIQIL